MEFSEKYSRKRILGEGSQAVVWLVENQNTKAAAAMKLYNGKSAEAEREMQVLRYLGGKGVPYLIDCVEADGKNGIVMEYIEGKSLRALCEEQKVWTEEEAVDTAMKIAEILSGFHKTLPVMIYADLKPENIMLTAEGKVYLVDCGAVVYAGEKQKKLFGTRNYLPPSEEETITPYRDTYGLGVILYEMLTGYRIAEGVANGKADISHLSPGCRRVMQKAVRMRPEEAYSDAGQMLEDLKACQNELKERKTGRRKRQMIRKRKKKAQNYFICDLKRVVLHGHAGLPGILGICLIAAVLFFGKTETEAAGMRENAEITAAAAEERKEAETETKAEIAKETETEAEIRDEYGRKLVIRKR